MKVHLREVAAPLKKAEPALILGATLVFLVSLLCFLHIHPKTGAQPQTSEPCASGPWCPTSLEAHCCEYWGVEVSQAPGLF